MSVSMASTVTIAMSVSMASKITITMLVLMARAFMIAMNVSFDGQGSHNSHVGFNG